MMWREIRRTVTTGGMTKMGLVPTPMAIVVGAGEVTVGRVSPALYRR